MKKFGALLLSLILLLPGRMLTMLFVFYFESLTGQLALGYILGGLLFGTLAALPVVLPILRKPLTVGQKLVRILPLICIFSVLLLMGGISTGVKKPI